MTPRKTTTPRPQPRGRHADTSPGSITTKRNGRGRSLSTWRETPLAEIPTLGYARKSTDEGRQAEGVGVQTTRVVERSHAAAWTDFRGVIKDNQRSASEFAEREREGFKELMERCDEGEIGRIAVTMFDRLTRSDGDLPRLFRIARKHGQLLLSMNVGEFDLATSFGRDVARRELARAANESEVTSERLIGNRLAKRENGRTGVGIIAFGWYGTRHGDKHASDGMTQHPREAAAIKQAAARYLDQGWTLTDIANDWNARNFVTPRTKKGQPSKSTWDITRVRKVLANARHAGLLVFDGEPTRKGAWEPIIDETTHKRLVVKLSVNHVHVPGPRTMLSGVVRCRRCGETMRPINVRGRGGLPYRYWKCKRRPGSDACGTTSIRAEVLEEGITHYVFTKHLKGQRVRGAAGTQRQRKATVADRIHETDLALDELAEQRARRRISPERYEALVSELEHDRQQLEAKIYGIDTAAQQAGFVAEGTRIVREWDDLTVDDRRDVLASFIDTVWVSPRDGGPTGPKGEPDAFARVDIDERRPVI